MYKQKVDEILSQELTRQEFIKVSGALFLTILGLPALINAITRSLSGAQPAKTEVKQSVGYGDRPYGS